MKTNFVRQMSVGMAAGLTFFLGCARPSAEPDQPRAIVVPAPTTPVLAQAAPAPADAAKAAPAPANTPAIVDRIPSAKPQNMALSPGVSEVVKLAQSGVGEEVILAYVEKYSGRFEVGADQVVYLNDLGVPEAVITSMLRRDGNPSANVAAAPTTAPAPEVGAPVNPAVTAPLTPSEPVQVATSVAPPPTSTEVSYFYDALSPYGSWVYLSGYGWCWQPTVAVTVSTWRPYCDRGRWYWSDGGWYWNSDYSWGWAAFHYGRWYHHPGCGWVWTPGLTWAPSWVSWRYADSYCGWAPLPPEAVFVTGVGFTFHSAHVSVGFDFGLTDFHYSFVHINNFCDYAPYRYVVPHTQVRNFYHNTTVVNNYIVGNNNTVINRGIGRETIARASTTRVREVSIRETQASSVASIHGDRIEKQGSQMVVYRPQLPKTPPPVRSAQFASRAGAAGTTTTTIGRQGVVGGGNVTATVPSATGSRGQSGVAARYSGGNVVEAPLVPKSPERQGRTVGNQPGNASGSGERNAVRNTQPNPATTHGQPQPNTTPQTHQQPTHQQPRANAPLFGTGSSSGAGAAATAAPQSQQQQSQPPRSTPAPAARSQPPVQNNSGNSRAYSPIPVQPQGQQPAAGRSYPERPAMSPKQYEQAPRSAPSYETHRSAPQSPPATSGRSEPAQTKSVPAAGGGGGHSGGHEGNASRNERSDRNR